MRALIVDDSYDSRVLAEYILNELGCDVQSVVSGMASLQAVKENEFDLIVMDWICTYISKEHTPHRQLQQFKKIIQNLSYKEAS